MARRSRERRHNPLTPVAGESNEPTERALQVCGARNTGLETRATKG